MIRNSDKKGLKTLVVPLLICADEFIPLVVDMSMDTIRECEKLVHNVRVCSNMYCFLALIDLFHQKISMLINQLTICTGETGFIRKEESGFDGNLTFL